MKPLWLAICGVVVACSNPTPTITSTVTAVPATQTPVIVVEVQEVPVTQIVEVTRQVEVTRIVERVITATPEPTPLASPTPSPSPTTKAGPTPAPAAPAVQVQLLNSLIALRREIEAMNIDEHEVGCSRGTEDSLTDHYESIIVYPTYNVANASPLVQRAHTDYRQAIEIIRSTNLDLYTFCLDWLAKGRPFEYISQLTATTARQGIDQALGLILPAIDLLKPE